MAKKRNPDNKKQSQRFVETAQKLGVNEKQESFDQMFKKAVAYKKTHTKPLGKHKS